jgi:hypothetical protein
MTSTEVSSAVAVLRALLTEDLDTYSRLHAGLDAGQRRALAVVLTVAFNQAATRRFGDQHMPADIIEFVADARARYPRTGEAVPAEDAEAVIRAAPRRGRPDRHAERARVRRSSDRHAVRPHP